MHDHYRSQQHQRSILHVIEQMRSQLTEASATSDNTLAMNQLRELDETMKILGSGVQGLHEETRQQLSDDLPEHERKLRELIEKESKVAIGIEEEYGLLDGINQNLDIVRQDLMKLEESVDDMQYVSLDGTLVWKITGVAEKFSKYALSYLDLNRKYLRKALKG